MSNSDVFDSVVWDTTSPTGYDPTVTPSRRAESSYRPGYRQESIASHDPKWEGYLDVEVKDPVKELEHTKDAYVSYLVVGRVRNACSVRESRQADIMTIYPLAARQTSQPSRREIPKLAVGFRTLCFFAKASQMISPHV